LDNYDPRRGEEWMNAYFELGPNETNSPESINYFELHVTKALSFLQSWIWVERRTNLKDLQAFTDVLNQEKDAPRVEDFVLDSGPVEVFRTYYSIGFCRAMVRPGDMIFAVDGVRAPLVLRRKNGTSSGYKVIGECYLWAALELDYWNPGTRKGIWSSRPCDLGQVQTRMIEIY
jgi:hypothetical protein